MQVESLGAAEKEEEVVAERKVLDELRDAVLKNVSDDSNYLANEMNLKRFLEARPSFDEAVEMLTNHLLWRNRGAYLDGCRACREVPGTHIWRQVGFDRERRPVFFLNLSQAGPNRKIQ